MFKGPFVVRTSMQRLAAAAATKTAVLPALLLFLILGSISDQQHDGFLLVHAFPGGAGGCAGGQAAVSGLHLSQGTITTGSFDDANISLDIDGALVNNGNGAGDTIEVTIDASTPTTITVSGGPEGLFRGILFRIEESDPGGGGTLDISTADPLLQVASVCESPVLGITHTSRGTYAWTGTHRMKGARTKEKNDY